MNESGKLLIESLTPEAAADLLSKSGSRRTKPEIESMIRKMIEEGAPVNPDGTIHFVKFTAYLEGRHNGKI